MAQAVISFARPCVEHYDVSVMGSRCFELTPAVNCVVKCTVCSQIRRDCTSTVNICCRTGTRSTEPSQSSNTRTIGSYSRQDAVLWSQQHESAVADRLARPQQFRNVVAATTPDGSYPTSKLAQQQSSRDSGKF
jgi:hypothetical protein